VCVRARARARARARVCVRERELAFMFIQEGVYYVVTLVCIVKTRTQCGGCIRMFVLIFVTSAGISIKFRFPLLVTVITTERDIFIASHILRRRRVNCSCCWFIVEGLFLYCRSGCSCLLSNYRAFCCFA
jgi:hypothetical protein